MGLITFFKSVVTQKGVNLLNLPLTLNIIEIFRVYYQTQLWLQQFGLEERRRPVKLSDGAGCLEIPNCITGSKNFCSYRKSG